MWQIKQILHHPHVTWHTACCLCYPQRVGRYACDVTFCHTAPLFQRGQRRYHVKKQNSWRARNITAIQTIVGSQANLKYTNLSNMLMQCALSCNMYFQCDSCSDLLPVRDIYAVCSGQPHILEVSGRDCGRHSSSHNVNVVSGKWWKDSI